MKKLFKYSAALFIGIQAFNVYAQQGFSVFGDYIYWNASEQTAGVWANAIGLPITTHTVTYGAPNIKFNWASGFSGGIGYSFPNGWDTKLYWTHLPTTSNTNYTATGSIFITPEFFSGFLGGDTFTSANLNWKLAYNTVDFNISHKINLAKTLTFSPSIGVKSATINQTIRENLHATLFSIPIFNATEVVTNNYSGIGPSLGLDGKWNFYNDFSLVGKFSTALMWGRWNVKDTYSRPSSLGGLHPATTIVTSMNNSKLGTAVFEYFLGLEWAYHSKYDVNFLLGYDLQSWPTQLRAPTFQLLPVHGDLTLQGVTCGISLSL